MSGRRSHPRFAVVTPWDGAMRVLREIVVQRTDADELLAVSHLPAVVGEEMTLDILASGAAMGLRVKVAESRPVVVAGSVRHRLRLTLLEQLAEPAVAPQPKTVVAGPAAPAETC